MEHPDVAICLSGLFRSGNFTLPLIEQQYRKINSIYFVITDEWPDRMRKLFDGSVVHIFPAHQSSQSLGLIKCHDSIKNYEHSHNTSFNWVIRQRIDVIGCSIQNIPHHPINSTILVPHGGHNCFGTRRSCLCDNWAIMSRNLLFTYANGIKDKEIGIYHALQGSAQIWLTAPVKIPSSCFKIVRTRCVSISTYVIGECNANNIRSLSVASFHSKYPMNRSH